MPENMTGQIFTYENVRYRSARRGARGPVSRLLTDCLTGCPRPRSLWTGLRALLVGLLRSRYSTR